MPIKFSGRLQQYIGRIVRVEEGKEKAVVYDFNDGCWLLQHSLKSRMEHYREMGIMPATLGEHQRGAPNKK
jgi:superfamily II DNA or RNA helicase